MDILVVIPLSIILSNVQGFDKCRMICENVYKPVCGHDARLGYYTFCSVNALIECNRYKSNNYTKVADGPCYSSVRKWSPQSTSSDEQHPLQSSKKLEEHHSLLNAGKLENQSPSQENKTLEKHQLMQNDKKLVMQQSTPGSTNEEGQHHIEDIHKVEEHQTFSDNKQVLEHQSLRNNSMLEDSQELDLRNGSSLMQDVG